MSINLDSLERVTLAAQNVPGPRLLPWPMPGKLDALVEFSTYEQWRMFFLPLELPPGIPAIVAEKYNRAMKLHLLAWIDLDIIKAGELAALATLELALKNQYGSKVKKNKRGDFTFADLLRHMVDQDHLTDDKLPMQQRCGLGSIAKRLTGEVRPSLSQIRNDLAHGYPFDGLSTSGLLEVVHDLIEYAYRDWIASPVSRQ